MSEESIEESVEHRNSVEARKPVPSRAVLAWATGVLALLLIATAGLALSWRSDAQKYRDLPPIVKQMAEDGGLPSGPGGTMPPGGQGGAFPGGQNGIPTGGFPGGMPPGGMPSGVPPMVSPSPGG
jgi:hypothetical protein